MQRLLAFTLVALTSAGIALGGWLWWRPHPHGGELVLYGNVDVRQVDLAFGVEGPIAQVLVDEGDRVEPGQTLAALDQAAFRYAEASAAAMLENAKARLAELVLGDGDSISIGRGGRRGVYNLYWRVSGIAGRPARTGF